MARLIAVMGALARDDDTRVVLHLIYALAALAEHLADLRETGQRRHQAQAARAAAGYLRTWSPPPTGTRGRPSATTTTVRESHGRLSPAAPVSRQRAR